MKKIKSLKSKMKNIIKRIKRKIKLKKKLKTCKKISEIHRVDEKLIIFCAFAGRSYTCSPKAIYEYMIESPEYKDFKFVWAFSKPKDKKKYLDKERTKVVKYNTREFFEILSQAKYWIFNFKTPKYFIKKDNQIFIQCWHGTPLKKLGCDITIEKGNKATKLKNIHKSYIEDAKKYDYFISPSKFATEKFISAWDLKTLKKEKCVIEKGYPRNDYLFRYSEDDINSIKEKLNIPKDKKVILYAPTFRDNQYKAGLGHTYELGINLLRLKEELSDDYVLLMRLHYLISNIIDVSQFKGFIYDVSNLEDINELYIISDMLVTDYSSVMFDYANLNKPILFYMYDLEEYEKEIRSFYINLEELPGPIVQQEKKLIDNIRDIEKIKNKYNNTYQKFNKKYNYLDDGNTSEKVIKECIS